MNKKNEAENLDLSRGERGHAEDGQELGVLGKKHNQYF